jgi:hypothetical protein
MMGRLVGAIPNLPVAGEVVASLPVVLSAIPSPKPVAGVSPALVILLPGVTVAPSRQD